ncbi:Zinc finger, C2H2 [Penicillium italicum]|uniref:Zinc finger, C2H2 n=1 Tax=Penicillium italicum TaxID=40296 RepID=A0A0A2KDB8_PENIT|nr:Zinc finger, C2H2 [Penicillium italicum]
MDMLCDSTLKPESAGLAPWRTRWETAHGDKSTPLLKPYPCPRAKDDNCPRMFRKRGGAKDHAISQHGKFEPNETYIAAWPRISPDIPLKDVDGNSIPGWGELPKLSILDDKWICPEPGCSKKYMNLLPMKNHYLATHLRARWPCEYATSFHCNRTFSSVYDAKKHADEHIPKPKWMCQYDRCLAQMQGRKLLKFVALSHYNVHIQQGDFREGECQPLKVSNSPPGHNIEVQSQPLAANEEDGDEGDWVIESEDEEVDKSDDEVETFEDDKLPTESAAAWPGVLPKKQDILKGAALPDGLYRHLGLKCPGPDKVDDIIVLGTQVCPNSTVISFETGVFYRSGQHVGIKTRCAPCNGRFNFNEFLRRNFLEADANQTTCRRKSCFSAVWEGSKFCQKHFMVWTPTLHSEDAMGELRDLFAKATSVQWQPETKVMAEVIRRIESNSKAKIPASELVNIDLEANLSSGEVFQIGLADLRGEKVLDCLTQYSEGIITSSSSSRSALQTWQQVTNETKVRGYYTQDKTLDAKGVVTKLQEAGISNKTMFLSWASWCFDLSHLRDWLGKEGFDDVLPGNANLCLLYHEFRINIKRVLGTSCYRGRAFPLSLPALFPLLFGVNDPLAGQNHHALVDAQQLSQMARVFIDLCKPPKERVHYQGSGIIKLGSGKRQRQMDEFFPFMKSKENKKVRL